MDEGLGFVMEKARLVLVEGVEHSVRSGGRVEGEALVGLELTETA